MNVYQCVCVCISVCESVDCLFVCVRGVDKDQLR